MIFAKNKDGGGGACSPEHDCLAPAENDAPRLVEPKDGGYGWVVVFASFMCMVIVDGVSYSYSVFNIRIKDYFNVGYTTSTWIGSLLIGCYLLVGPFVSMLANRYGCRRITIVGACISCTAFIFAVFSPNIEVLIITFGILGGIGFGLIYLPAIVIVGHWFERKRAFATGITVCGSGIGSFIFPPLSRYLLDEYDWRGAVAILAGLVLNCAVLGALFRPLEPPKTRRMKRGIVHPGLIMKALIEEKKRQRTISNGSLDNCIITKDNRIIKIDSISIRSRNGLYPARIKDNCKLSSKSLNKSKNSLVLIDNGTIMCTNSGAVYKPVVRGRSSSQRLTAIPPHMRSVMKPPIQVSSTSAVSEDVNADCNVPKAQSYDTIPLTQQWESLTEVPVNSCKKSLSCNSVEHLKDNPKTLSTSFVNMPVSTFDSAYSSNVKLGGSQANRNGLVGGSMMSEPQFSASIQSLEYLYEDDSSCLSSTMQVLRKILDLSLLKSPMFALLCFLSTMSMLGFFVPFVYMQVFAESAVHVEKKDSAFLLSIIGIANTVGRVLSGWVADRPWANSLVLNNMALILAGILTILLPFCNSYALLACFAAGFGICIAAFVSLRSILLVDLLGLEKLTNSFGLLILFQGVATMGGSPLAGAVMETSGSTDYAFYMAGVFLLLSGALGAPLRRIKQWEEGSKAPSLPHNTTVHETVHLESVETAI